MMFGLKMTWAVIFLTTALLCVLSPTLALAQQSGDLSLGTIVVTDTTDGTRAVGYKPTGTDTAGPFGKRQILDTPYSINVMSRDLLDTTGAVTVDDVLRINPVVQLTFSTDRTVAMYNIRGFAIGQTSGRMFDGLRKYSLYTPLEDKERVEVISGLSGFLYGPAAVGGSVNYVLKRPTAQRMATLRLTTTERGGASAHLDLGGPIDAAGRFGYRINLAGRGGNTSVKKQLNEYSVFSGAFDFKATENLLLRFNVYRNWNHYVKVSSNFALGGATSWPKAPDPQDPMAFGGRTNIVSEGYGLGANWKINDHITFRTAFQQSQEEMKYRLYKSVRITSNRPTYVVSENTVSLVGPKANQLSTYTYFDFKFNTGLVKHELTVGYSGEKNKMDWGLENNRPPMSKTIYHNYTLGDIITFSDQWQLIGGLTRAQLRLSDYQTNTFDKVNKVTPTVSLLFKPAPNWTLYTTYMESLEQGTLVGDQDSVGRPYTNAGQYLPAFVSEQYEIGAKAEFGNLYLTLALFQIDKANSFEIDNNNGTLTMSQDGRQVHKGLEFTATGKITENLSVYSGLTIMKARQKKTSNRLAMNKIPASVSEKMFKVFLDYNIPFVKGLSINGGINYTGPFYSDVANNLKLPGFTTFDLGAGFETTIAGIPVNFNLAGKNIFDKHYWQRAGGLGYPRSILLSAQFKFI
ncbi:MAG: TonB-dependent receptor [Deltaproteobacteria bacterium]|jgi:iron complex outermembrane receptor protein|nr:TonB-dependent receptor [Deltaproteobacteria bacterium]